MLISKQQAFRFFSMPLLITVISLVAIFNLKLNELWLNLAHYTFFFIALAGILLSYNYGWARYTTSFLLLIACYISITYLVKLPIFSTSSESLLVRPTTAYALISFLFPLLICLNCFFTNQGNTFKNLLLRLALLGSLAIFFWLVTLAYPLPLTDLLTTSYIPTLLLPNFGLSQASQLIFLFVCLMLTIAFWRKPSSFLATNLISLALITLTLQFFYLPTMPVISFLAGVLILLFALLQEVFALAFTDELTKIPARRALNKYLSNLGKKYSLAMADIDHFKKFNDTYGHDKGDKVLQRVAHLLNQIKGGGKAFRYGGEEFTLVFKNITAEQALPYIEEVRQLIATDKICLDKANKKEINVTMSFGLAENNAELATSDAVIKAADAALYRAKKAGRNRVNLAK